MKTFSPDKLSSDMKSKTGPPVETILFPNQKIDPYQTTAPPRNNFTSCHFKLHQDGPMISRAKENLHLLELTQPHLLLQKIFQPYLLLVKVLGCQPLRIRDGTATFKVFSWSVLYSLFIFIIFAHDTSTFFPIMNYMNSEKNKNLLVYYTEVILLTSQIFAAQMSYIFIAARARKIASFWNRLQAAIMKLVARCPSHLDLLPSYRTARWKMCVWFMFTLTLGSCYMFSFIDEIKNYLNSKHYSAFYCWFIYIGFPFYAVLLCIHILHSTGLTTFICVLWSCFNTLGNIALKQDAQGTMRNSQSYVLFQEISEIYEELVNLKTMLGDVFGIYLAMEILAMMICITSNCFFMISKPGLTSLFFLNVAISMPYLVWFHGICQSGEELFCSTKKCYRNIRKAISIASIKVSASDIAPMHIDPPACISAAGYFTIDMRLFTTVVGTIATYLVVMVQFGTMWNSTLAPESLGTNLTNGSGNDSSIN